MSVGIVDEGEGALGRDEFDDLIEVLIGVGEADDVFDVLDAEFANLFAEFLGVIDGVMGSGLEHPLLRFGTRGRADDGDSGEAAGELDEDGADAAGGSDDEQGAGLLRLAERNAQAVEEQLPCGDGGERQSSGFGEGERARLVSGEALIDEMELAVGARAVDGSGVEDLIAGLEDVTSAPTDSTTPAQSKPRILGCASVPWARMRTLVSTD